MSFYRSYQVAYEDGFLFHLLKIDLNDENEAYVSAEISFGQEDRRAVFDALNQSENILCEDFERITNHLR